MASGVCTTTAIRRYPAWPTLENASMRLTFVWRRAAMLPISMEAIATAAIAPSQMSLAGAKAVVMTRRSVASAIVLVAVAMNAMTAVGAPS